MLRSPIIEENGSGRMNQNWTQIPQIKQEESVPVYPNEYRRVSPLAQNRIVEKIRVELPISQDYKSPDRNIFASPVNNQSHIT